MRRIEPRDEKDLTEAIACAATSMAPLRLVGADSRDGLGRPVEAEAELRLGAISGIVFYEPAELVLRARAGTPLAEIVELLGTSGQRLAFEPIDHGHFYGRPAGSCTIGGMVAVNASGPRRIAAGAARDHLLGFRGATGRGEIVVSGGRVMKNVTGYDLCKLVAGSHGTLLALTETTIKTLPKPETETTLTFAAADDASGLALLREATAQPVDITGFALTPGGAGGAARGSLRLEGSALSVRKRLEALLAPGGLRLRGVEALEGEASQAHWRKLRDGGPVRKAQGCVWRLSVTPSAAAGLMDSLRGDDVDVTSHVYDWAGGLIWLAARGEPLQVALAVRRAVEVAGGHATLMRADSETRSTVPVFHPQPSGLAALASRVKDGFDPLRLLNRGRLRQDL